ncbi:unnamed protein product [Protopolystoma xenopodis]|uniref:Uncharacterized protein n=1 Tax=Protopolystoma xenopodis TaxID=117903 RepID=A0A448WAJ9_9PLAT|nr:unnamed protein product [Protopolystoma xenopodis]
MITQQPDNFPTCIYFCLFFGFFFCYQIVLPLPETTIHNGNQNLHVSLRPPVHASLAGNIIQQYWKVTPNHDSHQQLQKKRKRMHFKERQIMIPQKQNINYLTANSSNFLVSSIVTPLKSAIIFQENVPTVMSNYSDNLNPSYGFRHVGAIDVRFADLFRIFDSSLLQNDKEDIHVEFQRRNRRALALPTKSSVFTYSGLRSTGTGFELSSWRHQRRIGVQLHLYKVTAYRLEDEDDMKMNGGPGELFRSFLGNNSYLLVEPQYRGQPRTINNPEAVYRDLCNQLLDNETMRSPANTFILTLDAGASDGPSTIRMVKLFLHISSSLGVPILTYITGKIGHFPVRL